MKLEEQEEQELREILDALLKEKFYDVLLTVILFKLGTRRVRFDGLTEARVSFSGELHFAVVGSASVLETATIKFGEQSKFFLYSPGSDEQFVLA